MASRIEEYALVGDLQSAALVGRDGSIDWLCWPRFDSDACFAALVGDASNGRWVLRPTGNLTGTRRRYRPDTLVLETELHTAHGAVCITDCMPPRDGTPDLVRIVEGLSGQVEMQMRLEVRFGYGKRVPWIQTLGHGVSLTSAPDAIVLTPGGDVTVEDGDVVARFVVRAGERVSFTLAWHPAHQAPPAPIDGVAAVEAATRWWRDWTGRCGYGGRWRDAVVRSLITLKALIYEPTGGIVAAPTMSLPEQLGGVRNWDYRYCWLRDATLTLYALLDAQYVDEATAFARWLVRAARGEPKRLQIMYGVAGERRLTELELPWLSGYEGSLPVRLGNLASEQVQLDVYGELVDCFHHARLRGVGVDPDLWALETALVGHLESAWTKPDRGIWETRGQAQHFTYSKVMVWTALDRMIRDCRRYQLDGPIDRWHALRDRIHRDVCTNGYDDGRKTFTQAYGSRALDASLLLIPQVGFLPADDPRVHGTVDAIRRELLHDGLVHRYDTHVSEDGLPPGEGVFLPCSFWLADALFMIGRREEASEYFEHLLTLRNDLGLLSEEYDPIAKRMVGNFPQAFSHVALVNTANNLATASGPATRRGG
jgi:GH15 family glucan-1,4-alpha-glucosidase